MKGSLTVTLLLILASNAGPLIGDAAGLRDEVRIYPGPGWLYADSGSRDTGAPPTGGWSATELRWPNLYWQKISLPLPAQWQSRRVYLHIGACAYGTTVYVNGRRVGAANHPVTPYEVDITEYLDPSGDTVLMLGLEDWSAFLGTAVPLEHNSVQHGQIPDNSLQGPIGYAPWLFQKRLWTNDIRLIAVPPVRVADVFVKPSVRHSRLQAEVTVRNDSAAGRRFAIHNHVVNWRDGAVQKVFPVTYVEVRAGNEALVEVTVPWGDPRLWSPSDPHLYNLVTTLKHGDQTLDSMTTRFGFREVWIESSKDGSRSWYVLNGHRQNMRGEGLWHPNQGVEHFKTYLRWLLDHNFNMLRLCNGGLPEYYRIADEQGLLVQSEVPFNFNHKYQFDALFWQRAEQMLLAQIRAYRNHPSVIFWGVQNEVMISSPGAEIGPQLLALGHAALKEDPTRLVMHEGDGDLRTVGDGIDGSGLDVQTINIHDYAVEVGRAGGVLSIMDFPNAAYAFGRATTAGELPGYAYGTKLPDRSKPWFIGEFGPAVVFNNPHGLAFLGGDETFVDLFGDARGLMEATGLYYGFQIDGFRSVDYICGIAPWGLYCGDPAIASGPVVRDFFKPVAVRVKESSRNVFAGDRVQRTLMIYNDDVQQRSRFVLRWTLLDGRTELRSGSMDFVAEPGFAVQRELSFLAPATGSRLDAKLVLELMRNGTMADRRTMDLSIFPRRSQLSVPRNLNVYLYEPAAQKVAGALDATGIRYQRLEKLDVGTHRPGLLIIGRGGYAADTPASAIRGVRQWVQSGGTVLVTGGQWFPPPWLSFHEHPEFAVEPFWVRATMGFVRAPFHPLLKGLTAGDFKWWAEDHLIVGDEGNYTKPSAGLATVIVDTGGRNLGLGDSPLAEYPDGKGTTIVNQLLMFEKIDQEPVCRIVLQNILDFAAAGLQRPAPKAIGVLGGGSAETGAVLDRMQIPYQKLDGQLSQYTAATLGQAFGILIVDNQDSAWSEVSRHRDMLRRFAVDGGTVILRRLNPARATDASDFSGVQLAVEPTSLRHPQVEKTQPHPLLDGVSNDDVYWVVATGYRNQQWIERIVDDVVLFDQRPGVYGLLVEPGRSGTLQPDSGQSYAVGAVERDSGVLIARPGFGLVCIQPEGVKGAILIDQLRWDQEMDTPFRRKAQRYLSALLANCRRL